MPVPPVTAMSILERVATDASQARERRSARRRPHRAVVLHPIRAWRERGLPVPMGDASPPVQSAVGLARIPQA